jgi:hypothetical protein
MTAGSTKMPAPIRYTTKLATVSEKLSPSTRSLSVLVALRQAVEKEATDILSTSSTTVAMRPRVESSDAVV